MIRSIIILGNHVQSLNIIQIAGRLGLKTVLFNDKSFCIASFSRYCHTFVIFSNLDELLKKLLSLCKEKKDAVIMPTNDYLVQFVETHYDVLNKHYFLATPSVDTCKTCLDKRLTYNKAKNLKIPTPDFFLPHNLKEAIDAASRIRYPVIIRPAFMHKLSRKTGRKLLLCKDEPDLIKKYKFTTAKIQKDEIIIQEYIPDGFKRLYSLCSFFANGMPYASFIAHRIRQRPRVFGSSTTFARTILNKEIEKTAIRFLEGVDYFGLSEIEFVYDERDKKHKLLEINPRTWKWHSIANKLDISFVKMLIDYFEKKKLYPIINQRIDIGWVDPVTDFSMFIIDLVMRRVTIKQYADSLRIEKENAVFSKDDIMPGIIYCLLLPYLFWSRR